MADVVRVDKWLWAVRLFKTRTLATEQCKKGRVFINNLPVKPSREIQVGEIIMVREQPITRSYKVLGLAEKRMSAKLVDKFMIDVTPEKELKIYEMQKQMKWVKREKGTGRPTKKDRRKLDELFGY